MAPVQQVELLPFEQYVPVQQNVVPIQPIQPIQNAPNLPNISPANLNSLRFGFSVNNII